MLQLQRFQSELDQLQAEVAVVTFELDVIAENYVRSTELPWPLLVDAQRDLYRAYGMHQGRWWDLAGPAVIHLYFKLFAKGRMLKRTTGDVRQLGGDVIVDPAQIVRLHHVGKGPADRPPVESLVTHIKAAQADQA